MVDQKWDKLYCPCSGTMKEWAIANTYDKDNGEDYCWNKAYSPNSMLPHARGKSSKCMYHHAIEYYLPILYCNCDNKLRKYIPNDVVIPPLDKKYKDLMNWQIQDEIVIDVDIPDNSTNNTSSNNDLNEEPRLASS